MPRSCQESKMSQCILASGSHPGMWGPLGMRSPGLASVPATPHMVHQSQPLEKERQPRACVSAAGTGARSPQGGRLLSPCYPQSANTYQGQVRVGVRDPLSGLTIPPTVTNACHLLPPHERPSGTRCGFSPSSRAAGPFPNSGEGTCWLHGDVVQPGHPHLPRMWLPALR